MTDGIRTLDVLFLATVGTALLMVAIHWITTRRKQ